MANISGKDVLVEAYSMCIAIVIVVVVLVILIKVGVFRKSAACAHCNKALKGTEQTVLGTGKEKFVLCKDCYKKIHPNISDYAKGHWKYSDYIDYLKWDDETREERQKFNPTHSYGYGSSLKVDTERCLFSLGSGNTDLVLRFADLEDYDINFKPKELKEGVFSSKVKGDEYASVTLSRPVVSLEEYLNYDTSYYVRQKGVISKKYEYELSDAMLEIIRAFTVCIYITENAKYNREAMSTQQDFDEIQKALALFMFDSMDDVTEENLKKQRNALIKAFHPDNNINNEAYSQKINGAYELLLKMIKK